MFNGFRLRVSLHLLSWSRLEEDNHLIDPVPRHLLYMLPDLHRIRQRMHEQDQSIPQDTNGSFHQWLAELEPHTWPLSVDGHRRSRFAHRVEFHGQRMLSCSGIAP